MVVKVVVSDSWPLDSSKTTIHVQKVLRLQTNFRVENSDYCLCLPGATDTQDVDT